MSTRKVRANLKSDILLCTVYLHRLVRNQARQSAENWAELSVLNNLEHWGEKSAHAGSSGLSQKELAGFEQVSQAAMSNIVKKLRERGFVTCEKSEEDLRSVVVQLTQRGRDHLAEQGPLIKNVFDPVLDQLSKNQLAKLAEGQRILSQALQQSSAVEKSLRGATSASM